MTRALAVALCLLALGCSAAGPRKDEPFDRRVDEAVPAGEVAPSDEDLREPG